MQRERIHTIGRKSVGSPISATDWNILVDTVRGLSGQGATGQGMHIGPEGVYVRQPIITAGAPFGLAFAVVRNRDDDNGEPVHFITIEKLKKNNIDPWDGGFTSTNNEDNWEQVSCYPTMNNRDFFTYLWNETEIDRRTPIVELVYDSANNIWVALPSHKWGLPQSTMSYKYRTSDCQVYDSGSGGA